MASRYVITKNVLSEYDEYVLEIRASSPVAVVTPLRERISLKLIDIKKDKTKTIPDKLKFLEFVYLTQEEYGNLITWYGLDKVKDIIQRMNDYLWSKGDKYKSHYHTILSWFNQKGIKRIDTQKIIPEKPEAKVEKVYVPMTLEQREEAKEIMNKARLLLLSKSNNGNH